MATCLTSSPMGALDMALVSPTKLLQKALPSNIPNSLEGFRRRTESFSTFRWVAHSVSVSPLQCARFGWECVETDLLRCVSCRSFLYAKNDDVLTSSDTDSHLSSSLRTAHKPYCIWSWTKSPPSFDSVLPSSRKDCVSRILHDLRQLLRLPPEAIPSLDVSRLEGLDAGVVSSRLGPRIDPPELSVDAVRTLTLLALCGWSLATDSQSDERMWKRLCIKVRCCVCRRTLGLWDYEPLAGKRRREASSRLALCVTASDVEINVGAAIESLELEKSAFKAPAPVEYAAAAATASAAVVTSSASENFIILRPKTTLPPRDPLPVESDEESVETDSNAETSSVKSDKSMDKAEVFGLEWPVESSDKTSDKSSEKSASSRSSRPRSSASAEAEPRSRAKRLSSGSSDRIGETRRTRSRKLSEGLTMRSGNVIKSPQEFFKEFAVDRKKRARSGDSTLKGESEPKCAKMVERGEGEGVGEEADEAMAEEEGGKDESYVDVVKNFDETEVESEAETDRLQITDNEERREIPDFNINKDKEKEEVQTIEERGNVGINVEDSKMTMTVEKGEPTVEITDYAERTEAEIDDSKIVCHEAEESKECHEGSLGAKTTGNDTEGQKTKREKSRGLEADYVSEKIGDCSDLGETSSHNVLDAAETAGAISVATTVSKEPALISPIISARDVHNIVSDRDEGDQDFSETLKWLFNSEREDDDAVVFGSALLDPVSEHRIWCPHSMPIHGETKDAMAWRCIVERLMEPETSPRESGSHLTLVSENLSKAKKLMEF